jgi:16S rRNA G1207 methylase RsmC
MPPLHQQRSVLLDANAKLIREWFRELPPDGQLSVLCSMLSRFSLSDLQTMNAHLQQQVAHQVGQNLTVTPHQDP